MNFLTRPLCLLAIGFAPAVVFAGDESKEVIPPESPVTETQPAFRISAEYNVEQTYVGDAEVRREGVSRTFDESDTVVDFVFTPRVSFGVLRLGLGYEHFSFGFDNGWPLPSTLQAANLVIGLDTELFNTILVRIEAQPGFYGAGTSDLEMDDLNVPFIIGGTYIYSSDLQFVLGVGVDVNRQYPVVPGGGIRWRFASQWVLNAVVPTPRLEYEWNRSLTVFAGATIKDQTYRMSERFGRLGGQPDLNRAVLDYSEVRVGLGFDWKINNWLTLSAEGGYVPYRQFDYHRTEVRYHNVHGAPYGTVALHGAF